MPQYERRNPQPHFHTRISPIPLRITSTAEWLLFYSEKIYIFLDKTGVNSLDSVHERALKQYLGFKYLGRVKGSGRYGIYQPVSARIEDLYVMEH